MSALNPPMQLKTGQKAQNAFFHDFKVKCLQKSWLHWKLILSDSHPALSPRVFSSLETFAQNPRMFNFD